MAKRAATRGGRDLAELEDLRAPGLPLMFRLPDQRRLAGLPVAPSEALVRHPAQWALAADEDPDTAPALGQALRVQHAQRLAHRRPGRAVGGDELALRRQLFAGRERSPYDPIAEVVSDLMVDGPVAARVDGHLFTTPLG